MRDEILRYNTALRISIFSAAFCNGWCTVGLRILPSTPVHSYNEHNFPPKPCSDELYLAMPVVTVLAWSSTASLGRASEAWRVQGSFPPSLGDTMVSYGFSILIECPWFDQYTAPMLEISKEIGGGVACDACGRFLDAGLLLRRGESASKSDTRLLQMSQQPVIKIGLAD